MSSDTLPRGVPSSYSFHIVSYAPKQWHSKYASYCAVGKLKSVLHVRGNEALESHTLSNTVNPFEIGWTVIDKLRLEHEHVYAIGCRPEVDNDFISGRN